MGSPLLRPAKLLEDETGLHLVVLSVVLVDKYGPGYLMWDSDALRAELDEDFGGVGSVTWERIQAGRLLHMQDSFWTEWDVFENVTAAVIGMPAVFGWTQPPEAEDMVLALAAAASVDASRQYSPDVLGYMAAACLHDGLWYVTGSPLQVCEAALHEHDARKNIERDYGAVAARLLHTTDYLQDAGSAVDVQVNCAISVRKALEEYQKQVAQQLARVKGGSA